MEIRIDTKLDKNLQEKLRKKYCDKCKTTLSCQPGCCGGCTLLVDIEVLEEPSKFKELNEE